jgi:hypothetical protein
MFDEGARRDLADDFALQVEFVHQRFHRGSEHLEVAAFPIRSIAARERNSRTTDDGDAAWFCGHGGYPRR